MHAEPTTATAYLYVSDPGHGWVGVRLSELRELGIARKITEYSYIDRSHPDPLVWLEEDCDLTTFARAKWPDDTSAEFTKACRCVDVEHTPIRRLPRYSYIA